ncbi:glutaredoxin 2 [Aequitasia blattaphilus]|uniref:DUF4954 family protein n=1 Tax=Aequitasia blattaphilus TaxID=2949332 RepID=A0ABT1E832_9FIRM|nr:DUF4954 family protein [Aequitasia blattaphilus]MCP1101990.1 DUF4954 family protein [Aequitasia blattaphilus]MCR8614630.1 DUF4954 family protein [Aequitasia blattaphilus]
MSIKQRKHFRLTIEAVAVIERRDKEKFPDEVDLIEFLLINYKEKLKQKEVLEKIEELFDKQNEYISVTLKNRSMKQDLETGNEYYV